MRRKKRSKRLYEKRKGSFLGNKLPTEEAIATKATKEQAAVGATKEQEAWAGQTTANKEGAISAEKQTTGSGNAHNGRKPEKRQEEEPPIPKKNWTQK